MRQWVRGSYAAFAGALSLVTMFYLIASATEMMENSQTSLGQITIGQTSLRTENTIRLLDKAVANGYAASINSSCNATSTANVLTYMNTVLANVNKTGLTQCRFTNSSGTPTTPSFNQGQMTATGYLECSAQINDKLITKRVRFSFDKDGRKNNSNTCIIYDKTSDCREQPTFSGTCTCSSDPAC